MAVAAQAQKLLPQAQERWHGFQVKVADGTTLGLPDTLKNQRAYPQSSSQKPGGDLDVGAVFAKLKQLGGKNE